MRNTIPIAMPMMAPVGKSDFLLPMTSPVSTIVVVEEGDGPAVLDGECDTVDEFRTTPAVLLAVQS